MTDRATPAAAASLAAIDLPAGLSPRALADLLASMPDEIAGLPRRDIQTGGDSATVIYLAGEESAQPRIGMVVVLVVPPRRDANAAIAELQSSRWGDPADHTVTASSPGNGATPAFREFWRTFPPGLFALPNQPMYFLLSYRAGSEQAFMVIATSPAIRSALTDNLGTTFGP
jgi:hypothetical protein